MDPKFPPTPSPPALLTDETGAGLARTRSVCSICKIPVEASTREEAGQVVLHKICPHHGAERVVICSSAAWYQEVLRFAEANACAISQAPWRATRTDQGCPQDCGACPSHVRDVRLPILPITSACNQQCPVCYTHNTNETPYFLSDEEFRAIVGRLTQRRERQSIINFTGGEPTLHPRLPEFLEHCREAGLRRLTVSTNGLPLTDEAYVARLAALDARIVLSFDTFDEAVDTRLLGRPTVARKLRALELLGRHDVTTTLLPVVAKGYNDHELGRLFELMLSEPHICSLELHTMTFTGQGGSVFPRSARITIPELHERLAEATAGRVTADDFVPSPLAHPHCYSICYLLCLDGGGTIPLARLIGRERLYALLADDLYIEASDSLEALFRELVDTLWADPDRLPESAAVLTTIKRLLKTLFPPDGTHRPVSQQRRIAERSAKAIYIHSHMDEETLDAGRMPYCCVAVPETDGRFIPTCAYNILHRERDPRFSSRARPAVMPCESQK